MTRRAGNAGPPRVAEISELPAILDHASSRVSTGDLLVRGIPSVRILSESRFLSIVRALVEDSVGRRIVSATETAEGVASENAPSPVLAEQWQRFREEHRVRIENLQQRLERLAGAFDTVRHALARLECSENPASRPTVCERPPPRVLRRDLEQRALACGQGAAV
jgi:hypothetical protein